MDVDVECLDSFAHGPGVTTKGQRLPMEWARAQELADAGLVRMLPIARNKMVPDSLQETRPGKAPAAGAGAPSSSSPAARASTRTMQNKSGSGGS